MRFYVVPEPVQLVDPITKKPLQEAKPRDQWPNAATPAYDIMALVTAFYFVVRYITSSSLIATTNDKVDPPGIVGRRVRRIEAAFEDTKPGALVGLEEDEYNHVQSVLSKLAFDDPRVTQQLLPFIEAFEKMEGQDEKWKRAGEKKKKPETNGQHAST